MNAPPAERGPLHVVFNPGAGNADRDELVATIERHCAAAARALDLLIVERGTELPALARTAVQRALADRGVVVAAGGDGTINTVAQATLPSGRPFGVLPRGTFNFFGRAHRIPADVDAALRILLHESARPVQVGLVDDRIFLVNASLGLHPQLLEDREAWTASLGRRRWVAAGATIATLLRGAHTLLLRVERAGESRDLGTSTVFVANNELQLEQLGIDAANRTAGTLAAVVLKPVGRWRLLTLALRGALGTLGAAEQVDSFAFSRLAIQRLPGFGGRRVKLAVDGEVHPAALPLVFSVAPQPLWLIHPVHREDPADQ